MNCSFKFFFWLFIASFSLIVQAVGQTQDQAWLAVSDLVPLQANEQAGEAELNTLEAFQARHNQLTLDMEEEVKMLKGLLHEAYLVQVEKATAGGEEELAWKALQEQIQAAEQRIAHLQMNISDNELTYYFLMQEIEALEKVSGIN